MLAAALYDDCKTINISDLKRWGYLSPNHFQSGVITWSRHGDKTGSISISVNTHDEYPFAELEYNYNDEPRKYKIKLVSVTSNLGKGIIWYFLCPQTNKLCRKLYCIQGYFLHREAFHGCMYESQTHSKYYRFIDKNYGSYFGYDRLNEQLHKEHFKKKYAGKPTKKYLRITGQIKKAESISYHEIERLFLK